MPPIKVYQFTDANFYSAVLEASKDKPVVVDFWASWCEPCRVLGPVLEKVGGDFHDKVIFGKLNVDENPQISSYHKIQSIPVVIGYRNGQPASQFTGALPEAQVRQFFVKICVSPTDQMVQQAETLLDSGQDLKQAKNLIQQILEAQPGHARAGLFWARLLFLTGQVTEGKRFLEKGPLIPDAKNPETKGPASWLLEASDFWNAEGPSGLGPATARLRKGDFTGCLQILLEKAAQGPKDESESSRRAMVAMFVILGDGSPLTIEFRRRLYQALH